VTAKRKPGPKAKTGRPLLAIDPKLVEGMAGVGATDTEIAAFLGCTEGTIRKRFSEITTKARCGMRTRLRQAQYKIALGGNPTMLIWLGKQMLGQLDKQSLEHSGDGGGPLAVTVTHRVIDPVAGAH
jgi:hypothetical protein